MYITAGHNAHVSRGELHVPKLEMVSMLVTMMQTGRIHLPKMAAGTMEADLTNFELKVRTSGTEMGALSTGAHDDLVTALGLTVYYANTRPKKVPLILPIAVGHNSRWDSSVFNYGRGLSGLQRRL